MRANNSRGFTLLEVTISAAIFAVAVGGFIGMVRLTSKSMSFETALSDQARLIEQQVDAMLIGLRWISVKDLSIVCQFPSTATPTVMPKISFRRIKNVDGSGTYIWGDRITYFWLPSGRENKKYITGDASLYNPGDIDGIDHDSNGVANDGVIWRKIETADGKGNIADLGFETFKDVGATDLRVVFENVPPPFCKVSGNIILLDSFKPEVDTASRRVAVTLKRFINTGENVMPDMEPRPITNPPIPLTKEVIYDNKITTLTTQRAFCIRN